MSHGVSIHTMHYFEASMVFIYVGIPSERERAQEDPSLNYGEVMSSSFKKNSKEGRTINAIGFRYSRGTKSSMALNS